MGGTEVVPFPLFVPLDGKTSADYVERVEPSAQGGRKMAGGVAPCHFGAVSLKGRWPRPPRSRAERLRLAFSCCGCAAGELPARLGQAALWACGLRLGSAA